MKPVLFLDIDGVLNCSSRKLAPVKGYTSDEWQFEAETNFDPELVGRLEYIVSETGCWIVLSSSWRKMFPLTLIERMIRYRGFADCHLLGCTPHLLHPVNGGFPRGAEIDAWLRGTGLLAAGVPFAIVDDDSDMDPHKNRLVQTDTHYGLTRKLAVDTVAMLRRPLGERVPWEQVPWPYIGSNMRCGVCKTTTRWDITGSREAPTGGTLIEYRCRSCRQTTESLA